MDTRQTQTYEMLLRVRDFGNTHRDLLTKSTVAQQKLTAVGALIDELTAADMKKMSASVAARAGRKLAAHKALLVALQQASQLVKMLQAEGRTMPPFDVPASKSNQALLTAGRQLAVDAAAFETEFASHGLPPAFIVETTTAFEAAVHDRGMSSADHTAARMRIQRLFAAAMPHVRRLDLIVSSEFRRDTEVQALWKQARRIGEARGARRAGAANAAAVKDVDAPVPQVA